ncbi:unnamed protein product [Didymodactylos carnosus]|uniref:Heterochromatin protein 1 n=1 Tax=Didymodactylos carnosus TaxID=1234261 RepID=A0A8S2D3U9_9BILA|nr:unnamed protein product [Didymodactylos carnosus]CAF3656562.1 unnamed protein product [Didymodactylos carnosus]
MEKLVKTLIATKNDLKFTLALFGSTWTYYTALYEKIENFVDGINYQYYAEGLPMNDADAAVTTYQIRASQSNIPMSKFFYIVNTNQNAKRGIQPPASFDAYTQLVTSGVTVFSINDDNNNYDTAKKFAEMPNAPNGKTFEDGPGWTFRSMGKHQNAQLSSDDEDELEEEEFIVERILDRRIKNNVVEYYLKWKNFPDTENTWEPEMNLDCPDLIAEFERTRAKQQASEKSSPSINATNNKRRNLSPDDDQDSRSASNQNNVDNSRRKRANEYGYGRGYDIEKILGATDVYGELMFLIKWRETDKPELVPARIANVKSPQTVIKFYEERLTWANTEENSTAINEK